VALLFARASFGRLGFRRTDHPPFDGRPAARYRACCGLALSVSCEGTLCFSLSGTAGDGPPAPSRLEEP